VTEGVSAGQRCRCSSSWSIATSPVLYFGGKHRLADTIVASFPKHRHYVEVCGGSLAVLMAKPPSRGETVNDLDHRLMTFWRVLRDRPAELERVCTLTPHSRAERELAWRFPADLDELEVARRVFIALTQGRTGTLKSTGWRHDAQFVTTPMPVRLARYAGRLAAAAARLGRVSLECRPAVEMVKTYGGDRHALLYVDPPYDAARSKNYAVEMTTADHVELSDLLAKSDAAVVVSGYAGGVWEGALDGWYRRELPGMTTQGSGTHQRVEVLWSNRELPLQGSPSITEMSRCPGCAAVIRQAKRGRRRVWCGEACRVAAWRSKKVIDKYIQGGPPFGAF
jgi:DNA adenine methylase